MISFKESVQKLLNNCRENYKSLWRKKF
jgi:hypothetical protein